jgi:Photosynthetic reaction centre cytochrome C subunit
MNGKLALVLLVPGAVLVLAPTLLAQKPPAAPPKNLQVLPRDISLQELKATMQSFADELGVKCTFCHVPDEHDRDDKQHKKDARRMIKLVQDMRANSARYFVDDLPPERINCWLCHRGKAEIEPMPPS